MVKIRQLKWNDIPKVRQRILQKQNGICPLCQNPIDAACLDHHHKKRIKGTGQVRGVLCRSCNVMLGKIENNCVRYGISQKLLPDVLRNMAVYLEGAHYPYMHPSEMAPPKKLKKSSFNTLVTAMKKKYVSEKQLPTFPKSGKLTKPLAVLFKKYKIEPGYYK